MIKPLTLLIFLNFLTACGGAKSRFVSVCESSAGMSEENCQCVAKQVERDLPDHGFEYLTAMIEQNDEQMQELRSKLPMGEYIKMGVFMVSAQMKCSLDKE